MIFPKSTLADDKISDQCRREGHRRVDRFESARRCYMQLDHGASFSVVTCQARL